VARLRRRAAGSHGHGPPPRPGSGSSRCCAARPASSPATFPRCSGGLPSRSLSPYLSTLWWSDGLFRRPYPSRLRVRRRVSRDGWAGIGWFVTDTPQGIQIGRHRDLRGREWHGWLRRGLLLIPTAIVVLALANVFGQHPATSTASTSAATMSVFAPTSVRGGLIWEARFDVHAVRTIRHARLVLDSDWLEANTVNTIEPSPSRETSRNGALEL